MSYATKATIAALCWSLLVAVNVYFAVVHFRAGDDALGAFSVFGAAAVLVFEIRKAQP